MVRVIARDALADTWVRDTIAVEMIPRERRRRRALHVSVVMPAKNEARNLPYVLTRLPRDIDEVILVDGHSTDDTIDVARSLWPSIKIIQQNGTGKGNALMCGFAACTGNIIVMIDADGSTDAAEIPRFVSSLLHGADFAKGSRFLSSGGSADITVLRRLGNWVLVRLVNALYGTSYTDLCYGYNAFWKHCLRFINIDCDGFEVETLVHTRVAKAGLIVHEVPSFEGHRVHGVSNLRAVRDGVRVLRTILHERYGSGHNVARRNPTVRIGHLWDGVERRSGLDRRTVGARNSRRRSKDERSGFVRRASDRAIMTAYSSIIMDEV